MIPLSLVAALVIVAPPADRAATDTMEVSVPFGCGRSFPVSQAHGTGSHLQNDTWAWDFRMPVGTPVVAAADGVVRMARGDSAVGGCDEAMAKWANYVVISHPGGYETQYLHFSQVVVKPGDKVKAGELIGYSGETGWACGAHLHFKVARTERSGWNNPSVPARILGYGDPQVETVIASPACKAPEVMAVDVAAKKADSPAPAVEVAAGTQVSKASPELAAVTAASAPASSPEATVAPPVGNAPSAAGGGEKHK